MSRLELWDLWIQPGRRLDEADSSSAIFPHGAVCGDGKTPVAVLSGSGAYLARTFVARDLEQAKRIARKFELEES